MSYSLNDKFSINTLTSTAKLDGNLELRNYLSYETNNGTISLRASVVPNTYDIEPIATMTPIYSSNILTFGNIIIGNPYRKLVGGNYQSNIDCIFQVQNFSTDPINIHIPNYTSPAEVIDERTSVHKLIIYNVGIDPIVQYGSTVDLSVDIYPYTDPYLPTYCTKIVRESVDNIYLVYNTPLYFPSGYFGIINFYGSVLRTYLSGVSRYFRLYINEAKPFVRITDIAVVDSANVVIVGFYRLDTGFANLERADKVDFQSGLTSKEDVLLNTNFQVNIFVISINTVNNTINWGRYIVGLQNSYPYNFDAKIALTENQEKVILTTYVRTENQPVSIYKRDVSVEEVISYSLEETIFGTELNDTTSQFVVIKMSTNTGIVENTTRIIPSSLDTTGYTGEPTDSSFYELTALENGDFIIYIKNYNTTTNYNVANSDGTYRLGISYENCLIYYNTLLQSQWIANVLSLNDRTYKTISTIEKNKVIVQAINSSFDDINIYNSDNSIYTVIQKDTSYDTVAVNTIYNDNGTVLNTSYTRYVDALSNIYYSTYAVTDNSYFTTFANSRTLPNSDYIYIDSFTNKYSITSTPSYVMNMFRYNETVPYKLFRIGDQLDKTIIDTSTLYLSGDLQIDGNTDFQNGNIGIGTTITLQLLDVNGNALIRGNAYIGKNTSYVNNLIPSASGKINGVNIGALNKRTRASYASSINAVSTWTSRTSATNNNWKSICWAPELYLFCAVAITGTGDRVMTSSDGITWTSRASAVNNDWNSVCWSPELSLFCAVASSGTGDRVMTSTNGIIWTAGTSILNNAWQSVCWASELSIFVAVGIDSGTGYCIMTSPNGIIWTPQTFNVYNSWRSVCWSPELSIFVAVSDDGDNRVMISTDGIIWSIKTAAINNLWQSVCWSGELSLFVAVSSTGVTQRVMTSSDGILWSARTTPVDNSWWNVCWAPELSIFVAVGANAGTAKRIMTSPDGIVWSSQTQPVNNFWRSVCWSSELSTFVAVSQTGTDNRVMTSAIGMPNSQSVVKALPTQMMVNALGNVGIGTTLPVQSLHVVGGSYFTGNVGIGTTIPLAILHVNGDIQTPVLTGMVSYFCTTTAPTGWLKCNGADPSRTLYASLFNVIGTTFGIGDGINTFNVPDLRGQFIRSYDDSGLIDVPWSEVGTTTINTANITAVNTYGFNVGWIVTSSVAGVIPAGTTILSITSTIAAVMSANATATNSVQTLTFTRPLGLLENDTLQDHRHYMDTQTNVPTTGGTTVADTGTTTSSTGGYINPVAGNAASETRPKNIALLACIKY